MGLLLASPVLLLAIASVRIGSPGPALFRQTRVGRDGRPFSLFKLRTMTAESSGSRLTARGDPRITPLGRLLRKSKLDELPELWNILCGDMSFVGPRPEVPHYVDLSNPLWRAVLRVRPGLTDPITLRLRNEEQLLAGVPGDHEAFYVNVLLPFKLRGSLAYLARRTPWTDVAVLLNTAAAVVVPGLLLNSTVEDAPSADG